VVRGSPDANLHDLANVDLVVTNGRVAVQDGKVVQIEMAEKFRLR